MRNTNHPNRSQVAAKSIASATNLAHDHDFDYSSLLISVKETFSRVANEPLFTTDANILGEQTLNELYLNSLPPSERQHHNCHACRYFLEHFGNLVVIGETGVTAPAMWDINLVTELYKPAFVALNDRVRKARVTGVFLSDKRLLGTPVTGTWSHIAVENKNVFRERNLTVSQVIAAKKENFKTVSLALSEFTPAMLDEAIRVFASGTLARSEHFIAPVKWLRTLQDRPKGRLGENILWHAIALAPEGYCHPRASVLAPLLDDIQAGLGFSELKARFDAKVGGLVYQRPQAAPTSGNIRAAEALVEKLGIAKSLERRFARLDEIELVWKPKETVETQTSSIFAHLKARDSLAIKPVELPPIMMTWEKFSRDILPNTNELELKTPAHGNFTALLTATNFDAPPILKWDELDDRNPVSSYVYHGGSRASQWNLSAGWNKITGMTLRPNNWGKTPRSHLGDGLILIILGAVDSRESGNALFPEILKDDLFSVRATIEAYSKSAKIACREEASACGYAISKASSACQLRVNNQDIYYIDRWE